MNDSFRLASDGVYQCDAFQEFLWQKHGFGTRLGNPAADITLRQIHSNRVLNANGLTDREREGDALVTNEVGKSIGIRTADCVPILLLDCRNRAIAAVHAGWRGTALEVAKCAIQQMSGDFHTAAADIYAAIGPCIRDCCYEVGSDVAESFLPLFPEWEPAAGKRKLNLPEANRRHLEASGVIPSRIFDCGLCTTCQSAQFFSYRREPENPGRMLASICRLA
ncbi:MAG: peptidoglycan editing factor PgeF [Bryobacteraceae bacterium]